MASRKSWASLIDLFRVCKEMVLAPLGSPEARSSIKSSPWSTTKRWSRDPSTSYHRLRTPTTKPCWWSTHLISPNISQKEWNASGTALCWGSHRTSNANSTISEFAAGMGSRGAEDHRLAPKLKQVQIDEVIGFGRLANGKANKPTRVSQLNFQKWFNQAIYSHQTRRFREAE